MTTAISKNAQKSNEWYTPSVYIEAARQVMGGVIDLDPASCALANETVKATTYFDEAANGLKQTWHGNVWLNCPFSEQSLWAKKLVREYKEGSAKQCVFLVQAATERVWFKALWEYPLCFSDHQILFDRPGAAPYHIYHGTAFVYLGPSIARFDTTFSAFGHIVLPRQH